MKLPKLGWTTLGGIVISMVALLLLHLFNPALDARWHVLSEYSLAHRSWLMSLCFLALALGTASLAMALWSHVGNLRGRTGLILLMVATVGLVMAAFFHIDPIGTPPEATTLGATLHNLAALLGNVGLIAGALLTTAGLGLAPGWAAQRRPMLIAANLAWIGVVLMVISIAMLVQRGTMDGPWMVGFANRLVFLAECAWLALAALPLLRR